MDEMVIGISPAERHEKLLQSYMFNHHKNYTAVQRTILADMRIARSAGALKQAGDLLVVLRLFLAVIAQKRRIQFIASVTKPDSMLSI
jgi:hypothetical protein